MITLRRTAVNPQPRIRLELCADQGGRGVPVDAVIEHVLATATAQLTWLRSVIDDLRTGRLSWSEAELKALLDDRG